MSDSDKPSVQSVDARDPRIAAAVDRYWRKNIILTVVLLAVWAVAGLGCGILFADALNGVHIGGFRLGFWFAQQGSIVVFVVLIFVYALLLNRFDDEHQRELDRIQSDASGGSAT